MSKDQKNESLINGLWERSGIDSTNYRDLPLIYFGNGKILFPIADRLERQCRTNYTYECGSDHLKIYLNAPSARYLIYDFLIEQIDAKKILLTDSRDSHVKRTYNRVMKQHENYIERVAVWSGGLQAWDVEVNRDLICRAGWNRKTPTEVIEWKFPEWKWQILEQLCSASELESSVDKIERPGVCCGNSFSMIIELRNGKKYKYDYPQNTWPQPVLIFQTIWNEAMKRDLDCMTKKKGSIGLHEELVAIYGKPEPIKILQFTPPVVK